VTVVQTLRITGRNGCIQGPQRFGEYLSATPGHLAYLFLYPATILTRLHPIRIQSGNSTAKDRTHPLFRAKENTGVYENPVNSPMCPYPSNSLTDATKSRCSQVGESSFKPFQAFPLDATGVLIGQSGGTTNTEKSRLGSHISWVRSPPSEPGAAKEHKNIGDDPRQQPTHQNPPNLRLLWQKFHQEGWKQVCHLHKPQQRGPNLTWVI